jgi:hypothetical protein
MIGLTARVNGAEELKGWARAMPGEFQERTRKLVTVYALLIEGEARQRVAVRQGNLKSTIHTEFDFSGHRSRATIGTDVFYGPYLEYGTGLWGPKHAKYVILPKNKKALAFFSAAATELGTGRALYRSASRRGGLVKSRARAARVVVRKVIHPGIRPRPFLVPAFERYLPAFQRDLGAIIEHLAGRG